MVIYTVPANYTKLYFLRAEFDTASACRFRGQNKVLVLWQWTIGKLDEITVMWTIALDCWLWESIVGVIVVSRGTMYFRSQMSDYLILTTAIIWKIFLFIRSIDWRLKHCFGYEENMTFPAHPNIEYFGCSGLFTFCMMHDYRGILSCFFPTSLIIFVIFKCDGMTPY